MVSTKFSNHLAGFSVTDSRLETSTKLFGTCASWMFSSFMIVQAFTYFRHYKRDSKFFKTIVYVTILLQLAQTGIESYTAYVFDSLGWGDPETLTNNGFAATITGDLQPVFESLTAFIVQCFFVWRIWTFTVAFTIPSYSKSRLFAGLVCTFIALVSALSLGAALAVGVVSITAESPPPWLFTLILILWNASSAVADITITICMMALLLHAKANAHFRDTRDLLSRLTRIVLQTGLLTSILALLDLPLVLRRVTGIYPLPWYILGKSEVISLLANLNARKRSNATVVHGSDFDNAIPPATKMSTISFSPQRRITGGGTINPTNVSFPVRSVFPPQSHGAEEEIVNPTAVSLPVSQTDSQCRSNTNSNADV